MRAATRSQLRKRPQPNVSGARGFTLIEMMVVVAIVAVMSALAGAAFVYGSNRARIQNASFELVALTTAAQVRASSRGIPQYIVIFRPSDPAQRPGVLLYEDPDPAPVWNAVDIRTPDLWGGTVVERRLFENGVHFLNLGPRIVPALATGAFPPPFSAIPATGVGGSPLLGGCSFCTTASAGELGVIRFAPDGSASLPTANSAAGGALALGNLGQANGDPTQNNTQRAREVKVLAISTPGGVIRVYQGGPVP